MLRSLLFSCLAAALAAAPIRAQDGADNGELITLNVQQEPLGQVLTMISVRRQVNIVAGVDTQVPVTANFYDATLDQALDWVLKPLGYAWSFDGRVYQVMLATDFRAIDRPLVHHTFHPNYISARELEKYLIQFISPRGRIIVSDTPLQGIASSGVAAGGDDSALPETLIVVDEFDTIEFIKTIVVELDMRPRQIMVEATIIEVRLDETNKFGVDWAFLAGSDFTDFESLAAPGSVYSAPTLTAPGDLLGGLASGAPFLTPSGTGSGVTTGFTDPTSDGLRLGLVGSNIAVFLELMQTVADTTVLANTKVLTLNKQRAELIIGGRLGYFGATTVSVGTSQQSVEFLEVGTQLRFRPYISDDGWVRLEIHPERSSGVVDTTTGLPTEATSEVTTNVLVRDGETIVIGGLIESRDVNTTKRIPFLGYLPVVGWLFSSEETEVQRTEIIVLITPHILENGETLEDGEPLIADARQDRRQFRKNMGPVARVEFAYRTIEEARKAMDQGNLDYARSLADRALLIDPMAEGLLELSQEIDARLAEYEAAAGGREVAGDQ
jgi:type IV pilus assembly protein PilQ